MEKEVLRLNHTQNQRPRLGHLVLIFSLAGYPQLLSAGPDLLDNGGFEEGPRPDCQSIGIHWDGVEDGCQPGIQQLTASEKHSGNWSQKLGPSTDTDLGWLRQVSDYNSVQEGKTYLISAWIKSTVTDGWGWNVFRAEVLNNDSTLWHDNMPPQETTVYDWRLISWELTIPPGSGINRIGASLTRHWQNGSTWYDDVSITEITQGAPTISLAPASIDRIAFGVANLPDDDFTVQNSGAGTLNYTVTSNAGWLVPNPSSGSSVGEADAITVSYNLAGLAAGTHGTSVDVSDPNATTPTESVSVSLFLTAPGDFDLDLDVDLDDFARMQSCLTGNGVVQSNPECELAKLDADPDVDAGDLALFLTCLSGANIPAALDCAEP